MAFNIFRINSRALPLAAAVVIFSLLAGYFTLAWSEPSGTMPVTVDAPINTGGAEQTKTGTLRILGGDFKLDGGQLRTWGETVIYSDYDGSGDGAIRFLTSDDAAETMRIAANGRVGIGTNNPFSLLHVKDPTGSLVTRFEGKNNSFSSKMYLSSVSSGDGGLMYDAGSNLMNIFSYGDLRFNVGMGNILGVVANERMVIKQDGSIGIGTASPTSGSKFHVLQNTYKYLDTVIESALPSIRLADSEAGQLSYGLLVDGNNLYLDSYEYASRFANNYGTHLLTIGGGNVSIANNLNVGGSFCVGSTCADSSTWNNMVSGAGGGGGSLSGAPVLIPTNGFSSCDWNDGCGSYQDISWDPSASKLVAVAGDTTGDGHNRAIIDLDDFSVKLSEYNYAYAIWSSACAGGYCCNLYNPPMDNFDATQYLIECTGGMSWCIDGSGWCKVNYLTGTGGGNLPTQLKSDGTYIYAFNGTYTWKFSPSGLAEYGWNVSLPTINGVALRDLGSKVPYGNKIYQTTLIADYDRIFDNIGRSSRIIIGYPFVSLKAIGSY